VVQLEGIRATVLAVDEQGPTRVRFDFEKPLDDPSLLFLVEREGKLVRATMPPVGGTTSVPYSKGALGF
jgi:hypothetical protein